MFSDVVSGGGGLLIVVKGTKVSTIDSKTFERVQCTDHLPQNDSPDLRSQGLRKKNGKKGGRLNIIKLKNFNKMKNGVPF